MTDEKEPPKSNRDFDAFAVRNDKDGKGHFHKIGAAFAHRDGEGYDIDMVAAPTNGRITLRTPKERLEQKRAEAEHDGEHWAYKGKATKDRGRE